ELSGPSADRHRRYDNRSHAAGRGPASAGSGAGIDTTDPSTSPASGADESYGISVRPLVSADTTDAVRTLPITAAAIAAPIIARIPSPDRLVRIEHRCGSRVYGNNRRTDPSEFTDGPSSSAQGRDMRRATVPAVRGSWQGPSLEESGSSILPLRVKCEGDILTWAFP